MSTTLGSFLVNSLLFCCASPSKMNSRQEVDTIFLCNIAFFGGLPNVLGFGYTHWSCREFFMQREQWGCNTSHFDFLDRHGKQLIFRTFIFLLFIGEEKERLGGVSKLVKCHHPSPQYVLKCRVPSFQRTRNHFFFFFVFQSNTNIQWHNKWM